MVQNLNATIGDELRLTIPESINLHITKKCNYHCRFCFAHFEFMKTPLTCPEWKQLINILVENGCQKVNFAGGEPSLVPFLPELIKYASSKDLYVSLISNGTGISESFLDTCENNLNLIGLSIDSVRDDTERQLGRCINYPSYSHVNLIKTIAAQIHDRGIPLKINTTITPLNWQEDMHPLICELNPLRWKVFQVHPIAGANDSFFQQYGFVSNAQFTSFLQRHADLNPVGESNDMIQESYCMITPDGRFYQDTDSDYHYSDPILQIGLIPAFHQIQYDSTKYISRHGNFFKIFEKILSH